MASQFFDDKCNEQIDTKDNMPSTSGLGKNQETTTGDKSDAELSTLRQKSSDEDKRSQQKEAHHCDDDDEWSSTRKSKTVSSLQSPRTSKASKMKHQVNKNVSRSDRKRRKQVCFPTPSREKRLKKHLAEFFSSPETSESSEEGHNSGNQSSNEIYETNNHYSKSVLTQEENVLEGSGKVLRDSNDEQQTTRNTNAEKLCHTRHTQSDSEECKASTCRATKQRFTKVKKHQRTTCKKKVCNSLKKGCEGLSQLVVDLGDDGVDVSCISGGYFSMSEDENIMLHPKEHSPKTPTKLICKRKCKGQIVVNTAGR